MKKRKGYIRYVFGDDVYYRPIGPDGPGPKSGSFWGDQEVKWHENKDPTTADKLEWLQFQDALDDMQVESARNAKGAKAQRRKALLADYIRKQWPERSANWVVEKKFDQRAQWWPLAIAGTEFEGTKAPGMDVIREAATAALKN